MASCWALFLPHHPNLLGSWAHAPLHQALTGNRTGSAPLLDRLGAYRRPVGPPVHTALLLGLSAHNGGERAHSVDALLDLALRGVLDGSGLGTALDRMLRAGAVVGSRVAAGLADVFRADPGTADVLVDCLAAALPAFEGRRDAHLYVELLADAALAGRRTVRLSDALAEAARGSARTQLARACRRVPQPAEDATQGTR
jgi:hypothetical protein